MGDTRVIDQAWLDNAATVVGQAKDATMEARRVVDTVRIKNDAVKKSIDEIKAEFQEYLEFDEQAKELANAKAKIIHVHQKVQQQFGRNDDVRQYLTGILEASDLSLVKQKVIDNCTEELMISCPGYWLAPCLVAIARWLADDKVQADKALREAIKRDDEKTSLLFALVCRRVGRMNASAAWLERYLAVQDPRQMERKMTTVLDAYSNGMFGPAAKDICASKIEGWLQELEQEPGFVEQQQADWEKAIFSKVEGKSYDKDFPYAKKRCTNWAQLNQSLNEEGLHQVLLDYFTGIFEKEQKSNASLNAKLDELLENYVTSYDNEELPLRREERMLQLIIEERGKLSRAQARFDAEQKALEETFDFTQLLTNAAMHADLIKASNATQRLAIALSKDWIISAYGNIVLKIRSAIPQQFECDIEGWQFRIANGNENETLCAQAEQEFNARRDKELANTVQKKLDMIIPIALAVVSLIAFISGGSTWGILLLLAAGGFGLRWYLNKRKIEKARQDIIDRYVDIVKSVKDTVNALCAERTDYIREILERDAVCNKTGEYLQAVEAAQLVENGNQRNIL